MMMSHEAAASAAAASTSPPKRRTFDKFKAKLVELFFSQPPPQPEAAAAPVVKRKARGNSASALASAATSPVTFSSYFYGYKTNDNLELVNGGGGACSKRNNSISSVAKDYYLSSSSSASMVVDMDENSALSSTTASSSSKQQLQPDMDYLSTTTDNSISASGELNHSMWSSSLSAAAVDTTTLYNPFLDAALCDTLLSFNTDLATLNAHFELAALNLLTDDDQTNLFNAEFMINYIGYQLLTHLKKQQHLNEKRFELRTRLVDHQATIKPAKHRRHEQHQQQSRPFYYDDDALSSFDDCYSGGGGGGIGGLSASDTLLRDVARHIYAQSENEPCGLKGCLMSVYLETAATDDSDASADGKELLTQFRFDSTSSLTTFELSLVLRAEVTQRRRESAASPTFSFEEMMDPSSSSTSSTSSSSSSSANTSRSTSLSSADGLVATLKRRFLSGSSNGSGSRKHSVEFMTDTLTTTCFLDSTSYDLFKRNFY